MRNYARIAQEIQDSVWFITESGMTLIMEIFNRRIAGDQLTDEQIKILLEGQSHGSDQPADVPYQIQNGMAILPIYGPIFGKANLMTQLSGATSMEAFRKEFKMATEDDAVKSILLDFDSPGGTSDMIEEAGNEIYEARGSKPINAIANDQIGSAAYWLATQASHLYGVPSGEVGSIGAYTVHKDQSKADANEGINYTIISAGKYKTEGNPHEPLTQAGREYRQEVINELNDEFVSAVARGRGVDIAKVDNEFGQGRMVPNKKAHIRGMIDGLREYDQLTGEIIASHPTQVSFMMGNTPVKGVVTHGQLALVGETGTELINAMSVADYEHSEPGTGSPPVPRKREDTDVAIESGSRRPDIPDPPVQPVGSRPGAPKAMDENTFNRLCAVLGVQPDAEDADERVVTLVTNLRETDDALRTDVERTRNFAADYPDEYKRMMRSEQREREAEAQTFVSDVSRFTRTEGEHQVDTTRGISARCQDELREFHLNLATGKASLAQFESLMKNIAAGGIVDYSEVGSSRTREVSAADTTSPEGVKQNREAFASIVREVMAQDNLDYKTALSVAAQRHPDMAEAYRATTPA